MGTQYRSVIFYGSAEERLTAEKIKGEMAALWDDPIVTEIVPWRSSTQRKSTTGIISAVTPAELLRW